MSLRSLDQYVPKFLRDSSSYYVVITDEEGFYKEANAYFLKRFGFHAANLIGVHSFELIHPDDHMLCAEAVQKCMEKWDQVVSVELRKPDGEYFFLTSWEFSALVENGQLVGILCVGHDITQYSKTAAEAIEYGNRVHSILEEMSDGFILFDKNWHFIKVNPSAERLIGTPSGILSNQVTLWDFIPETSDLDFISRFKESKSKQIRLQFEQYFPQADRWFSIWCQPYLEGLIVFFKETSQEVKQREALFQSQQKLQALLDSTQDSNVYYNFEFKVVTVNARAREESLVLLGRRIQVGDDIRDFLEPTFREEFVQASMQALEGQIVDMDVSIEQVWFNFRFFPVKNDLGVIRGVALNARNIDQNKKASLLIQEQEAILRAIYNSSTESHTFLDKDLTIRFINSVAKRDTNLFFGHEAQIGENSLNFIIPEYQSIFHGYYQQVLTGERLVFEEEWMGKWWKMTISPVFNDDQKEIMGISLVVQDTTEARVREAKILRQNQILREISWRQSHEIRRPVATILGILELMKQEKTDLPSHLIDYCNYLTEAAKQLDHLTAEIVDQVNDQSD